MPERPAARHRAARHRANRGRRKSLGAFCALLLVAATAFAVVYFVRSSGIMRSGLTQSGRQQASSAATGGAGRLAAHAVSTAGPAGKHLATTAGQAAGRDRRPDRPRGPGSQSPSPSPSTEPSRSPAPSPSASAPPPGRSLTAARQVLALINQARAQAGLPAYTLSSGLDQSAGAHNARMAAGCGLSHQCPGEPSLGTRETDAGVTWTSAGENIGEGGPVSGNPAAIAQMALGLTQDMLNEQPPDDGHRLNILSSAFQVIGIAVYRDSSGTVWMTQDFSN